MLAGTTVKEAAAPKPDVSNNSKLGSVIDLFCGAGGLSYGLKSAGLNIAGGFDIDGFCKHAYEHNMGASFYQRDVASLSAADLENVFLPNKKRVLVGCAPCQPFSTYNPNNEDPKWNLVNSFSRIIVDTLPDIVSMENVPQLKKFSNGKMFKNFVKTLEDNGYNVDYDILYCPDYGLAQTRSRLVLLASRLGPIYLPKKTHKGAHRDVRSEIGDLPKLEAGQEHPDDPMHKAPALSELNMKRIQASKPGGTWRDWPKDIVAECHTRDKGKNYSSVYGRMSWDAPSPTITTQFFGFGNGRFGHPEQDRALSLREGAMLQGFPENYQFVPPKSKMYTVRLGKLIGNAVPVTLAQRIGEVIYDHLLEYEVKP